MRSFIGFGQKSYIGQPQAQAIKLAGISGMAVPLLFQWFAYGASTSSPNINVLVDLGTQPCVKLDQIRSIYIDNTGSDNPIYVYFPDTLQVIPCQPNSTVWAPAFTNGRVLWVIGEGFLTGDIPQTFIQVCNLPVIPATNIEIATAVALWKASATITRGSTIYNTNFGIPALGDQTAQYNGSIAAPGVLNDHLWGTPLPSGFLYLTHIDITLSAISAPAGGGVNLVLESTGVGGVLYFFAFSCGQTINAKELSPIERLLSWSAMNIKLDATQQWRWRCTALTTLTCSYQAAFNFTTNQA